MKQGTVSKVSSKQAFTIVELLVVVAVIGILVGISLPIFNKQLEKSREATDIANLRSAYSAARYLAAHGEFTATDADGSNPQTWTWEGDWVYKNGVRDSGQHFFYDPESGQIYYTCPAKPCGKGTSVDGGTQTMFLGKGEYRATADFTGANIVIYYENRNEDGGRISVYFGYADGSAVIQH